MVLSEADVDQLLSSINQLSNEHKHLIFTALEPLDSPQVIVAGFEIVFVL